MEVIWSLDRPVLVREVRERLQYTRPVAYTTVMTVMTILHGKGVLRREKHDRAWRYWPERRAGGGPRSDAYPGSCRSRPMRWPATSRRSTRGSARCVGT